MTKLFSESEIKAINCIFDKVVHRANKPYNNEEQVALKVLEKAKNGVATLKSSL